MSDAPERIGLVGNGLGQWALATQDEAMFAVHYVRADLHDALRARIAELEEVRIRLLNEKLSGEWREEVEATARNEALEEAAKVAEDTYVSDTFAPKARIAAAIRALKDRNETEPEREPDNLTDNLDNRLDGEREET